MKFGVQIGVLASEWKDKGDTGAKQSCDTAVSVAKSMGLGGLEVFERHIMAYYDNPEYLKNLLEQDRMTLSGVYFSMNESIKNRVVTLEAAENACAFMKKVGGEFLLLNGGPHYKGDYTFTAEDFSALAQTANALGKIAVSHGISAVMHPHFGCMVETNDQVESLLDAGLDTDTVGLCVHASHQVLTGTDPYAMYEGHAELVRYVHVGNGTMIGGKHVGSLLGEGDLDQHRLMKPLLEAGFDGWIVVECNKEGVTMKDYMEDSHKYLRTSFPGITWE